MISKSQLKYIQSLGQKKYRDEAGVFIAEGPKLVKEILQSKNAGFIHLYALDEWIRINETLVKGIDVTIIDEIELERISQLKTPNQVIAVIKKYESQEPLTKGKISLVLDAIQDPGLPAIVLTLQVRNALAPLLAQPPGPQATSRIRWMPVRSGRSANGPPMPLVTRRS